MAKYILGYVTGKENAQHGERDQEQANKDRSAYNMGHKQGHNAGSDHERPAYTRDDLEAIRKIEDDYLSYFAN